MHYNIFGDGTVEVTHAKHSLQYIENVVYKNSPENYTYFTEMGYEGYAHVISVKGIKFVR
jgi:glutamine cyclotransferase